MMIPLVYSAGYSRVVIINPSPPLPGASAMMNEIKESLLVKFCSIYVHHIRLLLFLWTNHFTNVQVKDPISL